MRVPGPLGARAVMDEECLEDFAGVFSLIDRDGTGQIPEAALVQALQGSGFMDQAAATAMAEEQAGPIDLNVFRECVVQAVEAASRRSLEMLTFLTFSPAESVGKHPGVLLSQRALALTVTTQVSR